MGHGKRAGAGRAGGSARGTSRPTLVSSFQPNGLSSPGTSRHQITRAHSTPKVRTMKTLVAVAILAMVIVPPALAKAKRAKSAAQQGYQSSERPGYYHGYPLSEWYRDAISHY